MDNGREPDRVTVKSSLGSTVFQSMCCPVLVLINLEHPGSWDLPALDLKCAIRGLLLGWFG